MATPHKLISQKPSRAELPLSHRLQAVEASEGPSFHHFTVSVGELLVVIKNWMLSKFFVLEANRSVEINGFNRPRSGGSLKVEGRMKENIGKAKYQRDPRNSSTHRK